MNRLLPTFALILLTAMTSFAQEGFWKSLPQSAFAKESQTRLLKPEIAKPFELSIEAITTKLVASPQEFSSSGMIISIPMPDGRFQNFEFFNSPIAQSGLQAKYPNIKTFSARAVDNYSIQGRFDVTPAGFHGYILGMKNPIIIDPIYKDNNKLYQVFYRKDLHDRENSAEPFVCHLDEYEGEPIDDTQNEAEAFVLTPTTESITLRTYRLALATTGEYASVHGGTKASIMAEVITTINRINSITERDFALRYVLVDGTDALFFLDAGTDPYTNGDTGKMIGENPTAVNSVFSFGDYDMGHVFGTSGGGLAQLRSVCSGSKARGVTSAGQLSGDGFYVDYVAHEMGHQMGSNHTFNNCSGFAGGNENSGTAYEPGSGSSIMSYSGICGANNILSDSEPYYQVSSLMEITNYMIKGGGNNCGQKTETTNHYPVPTINREGGFFIPIKTAFKLDGEGVDEDGDNLTYCWDQFDLGPLSDIGIPKDNAPIFRFNAPTEKTYRIFPALQKVLNGSPDKTEVLPTYSRDLTFQFVVRDNHADAGSAAWTKIKFKATVEAGPFIVTSPGLSNKTWKVGEFAKVEWNVANTDQAPVNCQLVNIYLLDGLDYDNKLTLAQNAPNNGLAYVEVPDLIKNSYHVIVEAADNVFLDASNSSHKIAAATEAELSAGISATGIKICSPTTEQLAINVVGLGGYAENVNLAIIGDWTSSATISLENTSLSAGQSTNLILDFENVTDFNPIDLQVAVMGPNDTINLPLHIDVVPFNYELLATVYPKDGETNVATFPTLQWNPIQGFDKFHIQMASSPSFDAGSLLINKTDATQQSLVSTAGLEVNTVYYWRLKTQNTCGTTPWTSPAAFSTTYVDCSVANATDVPLSISTNNPGTVTSIINITASGTIDDLNIKHITGNHKYIGDLSLKVIAPSGESAKLFTHKCANASADFDWSFDDASTQPSPCAMSGVLKPEEPLSVFTGLNTQGEWKLEVNDSNIGSGGKISGWSIELCSDATLNPPHIVNNNVLDIMGESEKAIPTNLLLAEDEDNTAEELTFTLVVAPEHGIIKVNGETIETGGIFSQALISSGNVSYYNTGGPETTDAFQFIVFDGAGGLIPVTKFNITVTPAGVQLLQEKDFTIFPNPTSDIVEIAFSETAKGPIQIQVLDITGRQMKSFDKRGQNIQFSTQDLASGIYLIRIEQAGKVAVAKLTVMK